MTERDHLAAEYALGLLEGAELVEARNLAITNEEFARLVEEWQERFAPLFAEYGEVQPPAALRERILRDLDDEGGAEIHAMRRRLGWWKGMAGAASAMAASLALVVAYNATRPPPPGPTVVSPAPTMIASVMSQDRGMLLSAAWQADSNSLMLMPGDLRPAAGRSHELWVIPADGTPRSLGVVSAEPRRLTVPVPLAAHIRSGATLAISVEPQGGSPTGAPTGPVIASGNLSTV